MRNILILSVLALASCASTNGSDYHYRAIEVSGGSERWKQDGEGIDKDNGWVGQVTYLHQPKSGMSSHDASGDPNRPTGFVGEFGLGWGENGATAFDEVDIDIDSARAHAGLRYYFDTGTKAFQPYLGGALGYRHYWASTDISNDEDDDGAFGFIPKVGVDTSWGDGWRAGVSYQYEGGFEPEFDGEEQPLDSHALMFSVGLSF